MSGTMSRNKGKRAEREVIAILQPIVNHVWLTHGLEPPLLQRNTLQSDQGGCDLAGLEWLSLEVKHCETFQLTQWWAQTVRQAKGRNGQKKTAVLFYRKNNVAWRVRMEGQAGDFRPWACVVDIAQEDFEYWFYNRLMGLVGDEISARER